MKDYRQFIKQLPNNTIVCALGEFNPPTIAHELLVKTVQVVAEQRNADHIVFTTSTDLISEEKKEHFLKLMFPKTKTHSLGESFFSSAIKQLSEKYRKVIIVAGADQFAEFKKLKESVNVEVISIGTKDPDADNAKMKQFASKGLYEDFKKLLPSTIRDIDGRRLMNEMRTGMQLEPIKEQLVLVKDKLREDYFKGKIFNVGDLVESNGHQYEIVKRGSNHLLLKEQSGELVSKWIHDVKPIKEGVIQPNGTDKVEPNAPESDTGAKQEMLPKGKTKGFLTFYNYKKDQQNEQKIPVPQSEVDDDKDTESDLDTVNGPAKVFDPTKVGHMLVQPETSHHVRRMKVAHHLGEEVSNSQDAEQKAKMRANLALKHAREKENLSHKHEQEKEALQKEGVIVFNNKPQKQTKAEQDTSRSGNKNAVGAENMKSMGEALEIPKDAPSVETIAKKHNVSVKEIEQQLKIGMKVEAEHGKNPGSEREIALDHLNEKPDYYKKLKRFVEGVDEPTGDLKKACWKGYTAVGMKMKNGKKVPNCVPVSESTLNADDPHGDYKAKRKALQDIQMDPETHKDPQLKAELIYRKNALEKEYDKYRVSEETVEQSEDRKKQLKRFQAQVKDTTVPHPMQSLPASQRPFDPFFKESDEFDMSDDEIDNMVESVTDEEIEELYEEHEIALVYEDTGEEVEAHPDEHKIDLMEVLSRQERLKGKMRLRKTAAKRGRSTKIALKRFSNPQTINKRARRLAIKLMKKRMLRGRDPSKISVGEKERIEKMMAKRKDIINRIATKLVTRVRKVEKARMSHGKVTKGNMPSVF